MDTSEAVPSRLTDLRDVPLADLPALSTAALEETLSRVVPDADQVAPVPVAAFQSAI